MRPLAEVEALSSCSSQVPEPLIHTPGVNEDCGSVSSLPPGRPIRDPAIQQHAQIRGAVEPGLVGGVEDILRRRQELRQDMGAPAGEALNSKKPLPVGTK